MAEHLLPSWSLHAATRSPHVHVRQHLSQIATDQYCAMTTVSLWTMATGDDPNRPHQPSPPPPNPRNKINELASSTGSACTLRMRDPIAMAWWCHASHASRLQAASWLFGPHLEVGHLATEIVCASTHPNAVITVHTNGWCRLRAHATLAARTDGVRS